jgi:electron transfer flavoprotein beta subunit
MKVLLCASATPDTTAKINFTADKKAFDSTGVQYILNPYDDHGMAKAMELKEKFNAAVTVIHVGEQQRAEPILRRCLAIGADEAVLINTKAEDAYMVAANIAEAVKNDQFDVIITGRESIDFNGSQVCDLLGEMLGIPSLSFVADLQLEGNKATVKRFIDGGTETDSVQLPIVISAAKELGEPRIPNMRGIMAARSKPLKTVEPVMKEGLTEAVSFENPPKKSGCVFIEPSQAEKLIHILHFEEKVI